MIEIKLYEHHSINYKKNYALNFADFNERNDYFENNGVKLPDNLSPSFIKNIWKLHNEIVVFNEGRIPLNYNYLTVKLDNKYHCYYIIDFEDLGNNQVKYLLKKDTITTFVLTGNDYPVLSQKQLIKRSHVNRFSINKTPRYDRNLEDIEIKPTIVGEVDKASSEPTTLALRSYGGGVNGDRILSEVIFAWEAYQENPSPVSINNNFNLEIPLGWGAGGDPEEVL